MDKRTATAHPLNKLYITSIQGKRRPVRPQFQVWLWLAWPVSCCSVSAVTFAVFWQRRQSSSGCFCNRGHRMNRLRDLLGLHRYARIACARQHLLRRCTVPCIRCSSSRRRVGNLGFAIILPSFPAERRLRRPTDRIASPCSGRCRATSEPSWTTTAKVVARPGIARRGEIYGFVVDGKFGGGWSSGFMDTGEPRFSLVSAKPSSPAPPGRPPSARIRSSSSTTALAHLDRFLARCSPPLDQRLLMLTLGRGLLLALSMPSRINSRSSPGVWRRARRTEPDRCSRPTCRFQGSERRSHALDLRVAVVTLVRRDQEHPA